MNPRRIAVFPRGENSGRLETCPTSFHLGDRQDVICPMSICHSETRTVSATECRGYFLWPVALLDLVSSDRDVGEDAGHFRSEVGALELEEELAEFRRGEVSVADQGPFVRVDGGGEMEDSIPFA